MPEGAAYRPATLGSVSSQLDRLDPMELGVTDKYRKKIEAEEHETYVVKPKDNLRLIAKHFYGNFDDTAKIFDANRDVLDNPDLIFANQPLRLPKNGMISRDNADPAVVA